MTDPNPYAAPQSELVSPAAAWASLDSPSLRQVGLGLLLVYSGICLMLLGVVLAAAVAPLLGRAIGGGGTLVLVGGAVAMIFVGYLLVLIGPLLCLAAPAESGSKGLIIGSVACMVLSLIAMVAIWVGIRLTPFDPLVSSGISTLGAILFMLFLRKLSLYIGRPDLARQALTVLIAALVVGALFIAMAAFDGLFILIPGLVGLLVFIMYANLVNSLRKALRP